MKHLLFIIFIFSFLTANAQKKVSDTEYVYKRYDSISPSKKKNIIDYIEASSRRKINKKNPVVILYNIGSNKKSNQLKYSLQKYSGQLFLYSDIQNAKIIDGQITDYKKLFSSLFFPPRYSKKGRLVIMPDGNVFIRYGDTNKNEIVSYLKINHEFNNSKKENFEYYDANDIKISGLNFNLEAKLNLKKFEVVKKGGITKKRLSSNKYEGTINNPTKLLVSNQLKSIGFEGLKENEKNVIIYLHNNQYTYNSINSDHVKNGLKKTLKNEKNVFIIKNNNSSLNFKLKKTPIILDKNLFFKEKVFNIENTYRSIFILLPDNSFEVYHGEIWNH